MYLLRLSQHGSPKFWEVYLTALGNAQEATDRSKFCVVCGRNLFVGDGVYFPPGWRELSSLGGDGHGWG